MKLHWGNYIAIFFFCFVVFMLYMVYKTFSINTELVSENYYDNELVYQQKIDKLSNTDSLHASVKVEQTADSLTFIFPNAFPDSAVSGTIRIYRPSDVSKDLFLPIAIKSGKQFVLKVLLVKGNYIVHFDWLANGIAFYTEETVYIK